VIGPEFVLPQRDGGFRFLAGDRGFGYRWGPWRGSDPHTWLAPLIWQGPEPLDLPDLVWESRAGAPEVLPDDTASLIPSAWSFAGPEGPLAMEDHGVARGFAWYRAHVSGPASAVTLTCRHACDLFLNGEHVATLNPPPDLGRASPKTLPLPRRRVRDEDNVLALLVENLGREEAWDRAAARHGLLACEIEGARGVRWQVKGGLTGEVEDQGVAGFADWDLIDQADAAGAADFVTWHRAAFKLALPRDHEAPLFLYLDRAPTKAYIYLNGQQIGRMWYPQDEQRYFWLPDGLLLRQGFNELLIAQWLRGARPGIGAARLVAGPALRWATEAGKGMGL
jgi:hypothetical protein